MSPTGGLPPGKFPQESTRVAVGFDFRDGCCTILRLLLRTFIQGRIASSARRASSPSCHSPLCMPIGVQPAGARTRKPISSSVGSRRVKNRLVKLSRLTRPSDGRNRTMGRFSNQRRLATEPPATPMTPAVTPPRAIPPASAAPAAVPVTIRRRNRFPNRSPYRHAANSGRSGSPIRTNSSPSGCRASPMFSVDMRTRVPRKSSSHASIASHRSSSGVRFQRWQRRQTTQRRPLAASNASLRPTGNSSNTSFAPRVFLQNIHALYMVPPNSQSYLTSAGTLFTTIDGTSISSTSQYATRPSGPKALGILVAPGA